MSEALWMSALRAKMPMLSEIPGHMKEAYAQCKGRHLVKALAAIHSGDAEEFGQSWWQILLFDKLALHRGGDREESLNAKLRQRLRWIEDGEWLQLVFEMHTAALDGKKGENKLGKEKSAVKRITSFAKQGSWRRALTAVKTINEDNTVAGDAWKKLQVELPKTKSTCPVQVQQLTLDRDQQAKLKSLIIKKISVADVAASPGLLGSPAICWKLLLRDADYKMAMTELFLKIALGDVSEEVKNILTMGELIARHRENGRVRPVVVPNVVKKIALSALQTLLKDDLAKAVGKTQFGIAVKDGVPTAYQAVRTLKQKHAGHVVLSLDASGAFSNIDRTVLDQVCAAKCPIMREVLRQWYGLPGVKVWRTQGRSEEMMTDTGVDQGDPVAAALFCIGLAQAIERLAAVDPEVHAVAYQTMSTLSCRQSRSTTSLPSASSYGRN